MAKCCVVFSQSSFEDLTAFRVRHVLLLVTRRDSVVWTSDSMPVVLSLIAISFNLDCI